MDDFCDRGCLYVSVDVHDEQVDCVDGELNEMQKQTME